MSSYDTIYLLQNMLKNYSELSDEADQLQMQINSLNVFKCVLEGSLLSSSHRARIAAN